MNTVLSASTPQVLADMAVGPQSVHINSLRRAKVGVIHMSARRQYWADVLEPAKQSGSDASKGLWRRQDIFLMIAAMIAGFAIAQSAQLGQVAIGLYGIYVLVKRVPSLTTFKLAFLALITTLVAMLIHRTVVAANIFATYTFLLLVVGAISLLRELPQDTKNVS